MAIESARTTRSKRRVGAAVGRFVVSFWRPSAVSLALWLGLAGLVDCRSGKPAPSDLSSATAGSAGVGAEAGAPVEAAAGGPVSGAAGAVGSAGNAWATWPMPNATPGLPNRQSFDTRIAGVVSDRVTGLVWQRTLDSKLLNQADAVAACDRLTLAGYDDWRLPSRLELVSIISSERTEPSIDVAAFPNTPNDWFWTSTLAAGDSSSAWYVYFYFGYPKTDLASNQFSVRCVRSASARAALVRHYDVQPGTVRDLGTGLTWQRSVAEQTFTFDAARAYCATLAVGEQKTWRVPSLVELLTLIDDRAAAPPLIDRAAFPDTPSEAFWTSSNFGGSPGLAWQVYFDHGNGLYGLPSAEFRVRCVAQ